MAPRPFTAAEDAYLVAHYATESLAAMADALKRPWGSVQQHIALLIRRGVLNPRQRHYQPGWTEAELAYLRAHWGLLPDATVAAKLGRTTTACALKAKRLGRNRKEHFLTAHDVARIFRVDCKTVTRWVAQGWLPATKSPVRAGRNYCWRIDGVDLAAFITDHLDKYDRRRIDRETARYWWNLAQQAAAAAPGVALERTARANQDWTPADDDFLEAYWGRLPDPQVTAALGRTVVACRKRAYHLAITRTDHFLTLPGAARALGVPMTAVRCWIAEGRLPARRSTVGGPRPYWCISPAAVQDFRTAHRGLLAATQGRPPAPRRRGQDAALPAASGSASPAPAPQPTRPTYQDAPGDGRGRFALPGGSPFRPKRRRQIR
jgi:hypothetical protein